MALTPNTIYVARRIHTLNASRPVATAVAVRDGRVLAVGSLDECASWGDHVVDATFENMVLTPGFIEAHSHVTEGAFSMFPYVGWFDRPRPDGTVSPGVRSYRDLIARLREADSMLADPDTPLVAVGFDPIYFEGDDALDRRHLDEVSTNRQIYVIHASIHLASVNSAALAAADITRETATVGVVKGPDGDPTGLLEELPAMSMCAAPFAALFGALSSREAVESFGRLATNAGITAVSDLSAFSLLNPGSQDLWHDVVDDDAFPARALLYSIPALPGGSGDWDQIAEAAVRLRDRDTDKVRSPGVKLVLDGSIQGFTAAMTWPGYYRGDDHGQLLFAPEQVRDMVLAFHRRRVNLHVHCNGGRTIDMTLDAVEDALCETAWLDHRHTIQHCQLTTPAQFRRMSKLGMCANIFANHLWYWGDQHYEITVGPERAEQMEPAASASRAGVSYSLHTDASVTPLGSLHSMWCAVNRETPSGRVLGEGERISPAEALAAVTLGSAYQTHLDSELGSIECGKWADFSVLEADPLEVNPGEIRDVPVWGTVLAGVPRPSARVA